MRDLFGEEAGEVTQEEIRAELNHYNGTDGYYTYRLPFTNRAIGYYTDGVERMAKLCKAYWLIDTAFSYQCGRYARERFQVWRLKKQPKDKWGQVWWHLTAEDGDGKRLVIQKIEHSDFPLDEIALYMEMGSIPGKLGPVRARVLHLPSER